QPCGANNQQCCAGNTCNTGLGCANPATGPNICMMCGAAGMACCAGDICQSGAVCQNGVDGGASMCAACGDNAQPCCPGGGGNGTCNTGFACINPPGANTPAACQPCGANGQACCGGGAADTRSNRLVPPGAHHTARGHTPT